MISIMATASLIVAGITILMLYLAAFEEERARLVETAQSQARLIEAVVRFDTIYSKDYPKGPEEATLSQIIDAHKHYKGFGETGEFTLARREGEDIVFLLRHRHHDLENPQPIPMASELAEPMRRALSGLSGTVVGFDYRGESVLAAYEPVGELNLGIVAKIDLAEIRAPFVRAGLIAGGFGILVVLAGALLFLWISNPMIERLEEHTAELAKTNERLKREIAERERAEEAIRVSYRFLEVANRHTRVDPLLKEFVAEVKSFTGCAAVGIRMLDEENNIPYQAYEGFSQRFYESENPLSINSDQCMCINVIKGGVDLTLPFYTEGGSFYINGTTRFLATVSEEEKGSTRNVCNELGYESVALMPIRLGDHILGLIHVADPQEDMVPLERVEVLERVAMQLGAAIQRVLAEEGLRRAHDELEKQVEERTAKLEMANQQLSREIEERKRAEEALRQSERDLRILSSQLLIAQEKERKRVAGELHDGIGQSLTAIKFGVENALKQMDKKMAEASTKSLEAIIPLAQETVEEVRRIQTDLRPSMLDDLGILATISWFCREFQTIYSSIRIEKQINIQEDEVPELLKTVIYRVLQEAMNNIAKHSRADLVGFCLRKIDGLIELAIEDNGLGFDVENALSLKNSTRGLGLSSMKERTELSGGVFTVESTPGQGTVIRASWR